jgi:uncharacterized protein YbjT (DUF2867 family)
MPVALTGAAAFIGSHILREPQEHGHAVTALVRNRVQSGVVSARGAKPTVLDLYDRPSVAAALSSADRAIHTASPGDAASADLDAAVVDAGIDAFARTGRPYLQISGVWVYGANPAITEQSPFEAAALVSWREPIERRLLGATGMRGVVIVIGVAFGEGAAGIPPAATTSSATGRTRVLRRSRRRPPPQSAIQEPCWGPMARLGRAWATTSPSSSWSTRKPSPKRPGQGLVFAQPPGTRRGVPQRQLPEVSVG